MKAAARVFALVIAIIRVEIFSAREIPLTFSLIASYGRFGYNSSPGIPAIDLALEHIHSFGVLEEYKLQYSPVKDSEVSVEDKVACNMFLGLVCMVDAAALAVVDDSQNIINYEIVGSSISAEYSLHAIGLTRWQS